MIKAILKLDNSVKVQIVKLHWQDTLAIRQEVLWPDKPREFCHVEGDETAWHYGGYIKDASIEKTLVCVASIYPDSNNIDSNTRHASKARLRKFATLSDYQNQGIGSLVLKHIIEELKKTN